MTSSDSHSLTLTQVLERHWRALIHETSTSEAAFAAEVRAQYERLVPPHARTIEWSQHEDPVMRMRRDSERISRWFREDVYARFPVEALEAFIAAFPEERRWALQQALAARQGLLAVRIPESGFGADLDNLGRIGKETGEAIVAVSRLLEDGKIDGRDAPLARTALLEIEQAIAVLAEMRERIARQALGAEPVEQAAAAEVVPLVRERREGPR